MSTPQLHPWLIDSLLHGTVFLGLALIVERLMRRRSAARRHALLLGAALGLPLLLAAGALLPTWPLSSGTAVPVSAVEVTVSREFALGLPFENSASTTPRAAPAISAAPGLLVWPDLLIGAWLTGIVLLWLRWGTGCLMLRRLSLRLSPSPDFDPLLTAECRALGIRRSPHVLLGENFAMPMTWGFRHHRIVLPREAIDWPVAKQRAVLRHELAHIARHDCTTASLGTLCLALAWFHPFAWLLQRALRRTREAACDDRVLSGPAATDRDAYARDLIDIVATRSGHPLPGVALAMGAAQTRLMKRRLAALLDDSSDRRPVSRRLALACIPLWIAAIAALGMTSAFRSAAVAQEAVPRADGEVIDRTYELIEVQLRQLLDHYADEIPDFDPESYAEQARRKLIENFGLRIRSADPVKLHFPAKFRLEVSAPAPIQDDIAWALDSTINGNQIEVRLHAFELDDPKWIAERIGKGNEQASVMTQDEFAALRKEIAERGGKPLSVPHVITRVGQRAKFEMIREFIYPTEYDPPQIVREGKEGEGKDGLEALEVELDKSVLGVTPANPTAFEMRPVGLTWETDPTITRDGAINMHSVIEDTQFLGFINYGSPIHGKGNGLFKKSIVLTENRIEQPIFEMERIDTRLTLAPGKLVALRGFEADDRPLKGLSQPTKGDALPNLPAGISKRLYRIYVIEAKIVPQE